MEKECPNCGYTPVHLGKYCVSCYTKLHNADGSLRENIEIKIEEEDKNEESINRY